MGVTVVDRIMFASYLAVATLSNAHVIGVMHQATKHIEAALCDVCVVAVVTENMN